MEQAHRCRRIQRRTRQRICNGLSGEDITCATCVVLALLPQLHGHFPQQAYIRDTSCKQTRAVATRVIATTTQQYTVDHTELLYMIFCFTAFDVTESHKHSNDIKKTTQAHDIIRCQFIRSSPYIYAMPWVS
jgi:phosphatidate phosphatase PAH1